MTKRRGLPSKLFGPGRVELELLIGEDAAGLCLRSAGWFLLMWLVLFLCVLPLSIAAQIAQPPARWWLWLGAGTAGVVAGGLCWRLIRLGRAGARSAQSYLTDQYHLAFRRPPMNSGITAWRAWLRRELERLNLPTASWPIPLREGWSPPEEAPPGWRGAVLLTAIVAGQTLAYGAFILWSVRR